MHTEGRLNLIELDILGHYKSSEFNNLTIGLHFVFAHLNLFTKMFNSASKFLSRKLQISSENVYFAKFLSGITVR